MVTAAGKDINTTIEELLPAAITLRRQLHRIPEIAWEETKTSATVCRWLRKYGIPYRSVAGTGIVALISSGRGKTVALRSDLDGLPIGEQTGLTFESAHPGRMHACGHDVHMSVVAAAAAALSRLKNKFRGNVKLIFQPAEEEPPGGAQELIRRGVMTKPAVEMIFGLHVNAAIGVGKIGVRDGALMAGVRDFDVEITGRGGHVALPHLTSDVLLCAAKLIVELQTIVPRRVDPIEPTVISVGRIEAGTARNVLPSRCKFLGTARAVSETTLAKLSGKIVSQAKFTAKSFGCKARVDFYDGYPPLINDSAANAYLSSAAARSLGRRAVMTIRNPFLGAEDFARYLKHAPGAMFHLGIGNRKIGAVHGWHHPEFIADENAIAAGVKTMVNAVIDFLNV